ncbi:MAG: hypothetical protein JW993_12280 [Sedimentisphaerales bacterium]|nr:hypothetical protein [Sedimentisphaerales bacterium]
MKSRAIFGVCIITLVSCPAVWADLAGEFLGYQTVWGVGASGLVSSNGATALPVSMFSLGGASGTERVTYPYSIGQVPSPGGSVGQNFDQGTLGVKVQGDDLMVKLASRLDPRKGYYYSGWSSLYGQGDVFLTVDDSEAGVKNFALLTMWAKNASGALLHLGQLGESYYNQAQQFHDGLEGYLVNLTSENNVVLTSGAGAYTPSYSVGGLPQGLDYRVFAQGGTSVVNANVQVGSVTDGQTWYLQTWTVPMNWLSNDGAFTLGLHTAVSCSNDQIGMVAQVPVPAAALLGMLGLSVAGWRLRRLA